MQIIEVHLRPGEGSKGEAILKELGVQDYNAIGSVSGDRITIRQPLDKMESIISRFQEEFKFGEGENRGIIITQPEVILPGEPDKERKTCEHSARECIVEYAETNSYIDSKYLALIFFSTIIAALGLITDNVAVVVGAMIIAPAFGPISSISVGVVMNRMDLFKEGIKTESMGVGVAIITAAALGLMIPGIDINPSLQLRMLPGIFDLLIAFAAGAAGGYVLVSGRGVGIVGVMVAAALIPVMAAIGLSVVFLNPLFFLGSFLLLLINILCIVLAMVLVFWFAGPQKDHIHLASDYHLTQGTVKKFIRYSLVIILILAMPLAWLSYEDMTIRAPGREIRRLFDGGSYQDVELGNILVRGDNIDITLYDFSSDGPGELDSIYREIQRRVDSRYSISFNIIKGSKITY